MPDILGTFDISYSNERSTNWYSGPKSTTLQNIKANVMCIQASFHFGIFAKCILIIWCFDDFLWMYEGQTGVVRIYTVSI